MNPGGGTRQAGRWATVAGFSLTAFVALLGLTPFVWGVGFSWTAVLVILGALVTVLEFTTSGPPGRLGMVRAFVPAFYAALVVVAALQILQSTGINLSFLLWASAAALLVAGQARKGRAGEAASAPGEGRDASSRTLVGLGLVTLAVMFGVLPGVYGVGPLWSMVMLLGAAPVLWFELRTGLGREPLRGPWRIWPPVYAVLVAVMAFQQLGLTFVGVLWLAAAVLVGADRWRKDAAGPEGLGRGFGFRGAGMGRFALVGAAVCLFALLLTWGEVGGGLIPGLTGSWVSTYTPAEYGMSYDQTTGDYEWGQTSPGQLGTQYTPSFFPGMFMPAVEYGGRSLPLAILVELALVGLILWFARPGATIVSRLVPFALTGFLGLWWLVSLQNQPGVWLFGLGLVAISLALPWTGRPRGIPAVTGGETS